MLIVKDLPSGPVDDDARSRPFRIAVPSFGRLRDMVAPMIDRHAVSREEILEMFSDRLRPGRAGDPGYTAAESRQAEVVRRLRRALYPKD